MLDEIHYLCMLPNISLDSVIDGLDKRFLGLCPARRNNSVFGPCLEEFIEGTVTKKVVYNCDYTVLPKERIDINESFIYVYPPISHTC